VAASLPAEGLKLHVPLADGGATVSVTEDGKARQVTPEKAPAWDAGHLAEKAYRSTAETMLDIDDAGDFEKDQAFSFGAWVKLPGGQTTGPVFARMDEEHGYRGWDLWIEGNRVGSHVINKFPDDSLKVVSRVPLKAGQWSHVFVTYDGSAKP